MSYDAKAWSVIIAVWVFCCLLIYIEYRAARARIRRRPLMSFTMSHRLHKAYLRRRISAAARQRILATYADGLSLVDWLRLWWVTRGIKA